MLCIFYDERKHTVGNDLKTKFKSKSKNIFRNKAPGSKIYAQKCLAESVKAACFFHHASFFLAYPTYRYDFSNSCFFCLAQRTWAQRTLNSCTLRPLRSKPREKTMLFGNRRIR